jgi:hypothetical protein
MKIGKKMYLNIQLVILSFIIVTFYETVLYYKV